LKRASEPTLRYTFQSQPGGVDEFLARNRTTGLLILKGDTVLVERYQYDRTPQQRMTSYSIAGSVVAMLVGIALSERAIASIDDTAARYVAELRDTPYGSVPIRHLLTMSSGIRHRYGEDDVTLARLSLYGESDGGVGTVLPFRTRERAAGDKFHYSAVDTQVLGLVLRAATGKPLADYLSDKIWKPMGAEADASWIVDKSGHEVAFTGLNATLRDYGRFGALLANDGALDGRQIIPAAWVRAATSPSAKQFEPNRIETFFGQRGMLGYGYQTWLLPGKDRAFLLRGLRQQHVLVAPRSKLVLVYLAAADVSHGSGDLLSLWFELERRLAR
jgi:CubicO group peptidase (beta-lactamase class C family)